MVELTVYLPHMYEILQIKLYNSKKSEKRYQRYHGTERERERLRRRLRNHFCNELAHNLLVEQK